MFFRTLAIRGVGGAILWGGLRTAVDVGTWNIARSEPPEAKWTLSARVRRVDRFQARQRPLVFTAPRFGGGRWFWPIRELNVNLDGTSLVAVLDHPEQ